MAFNLKKNPLRFEDASGNAWTAQIIDGKLEFSKEGFNTVLSLDTQSTSTKKWMQWFDSSNRYNQKISDAVTYLQVSGNAVSNIADENATPTIRALTKSSSLGATYPGFIASNYSNMGGFPVLELIQSRGTSDSALPVQAGDFLGGVNFWGQGGTGTSNVRAGVRVEGYALDNWTTTTGSARFRVRTVEGTTEYNAFEARAGSTEAALEIGSNRSGNRHAYLDLVGDDTYTDYGARFHRENTGPNAVTNLMHNGTGAMRYFAIHAAPQEWWTSSVLRMTLSATGQWLGLGTAPVANQVITGLDGNIATKWDQNGQTFIRAENSHAGAAAQSSIYASSTAGSVVIGSTGLGWSLAAGGNWEILNGGAGYLNASHIGGLSIVATHSSGAVNVLSGGALNTNIRARWSAAGNLALGYGDKTDAAEKIQLKNGNIKLDGVIDNGINGGHGIIYPDNTKQTSASNTWPVRYESFDEFIRMSGPIAYWRLNESSSSVATDVMGSNHGNIATGVIKGQSSLVPFEANSSMLFPGTTTSFIEVPYNSSLCLSTCISVTVVAKFQSLSAGVIVSKTEAGGYSLAISTANRLEFSVYTAGSYKTASYLIAAWTALRTYLISATWDGRYIKLWVDGVNVATTDNAAVQTMTYASNNSLTIGAESQTGSTPATAASDTIEAWISNVAIHNYALTSEQQLRMYSIFQRQGTIAVLNSLKDVAITAPASGQILAYSTPMQKWINKNPDTTTVWYDTSETIQPLAFNIGTTLIQNGSGFPGSGIVRVEKTDAYTVRQWQINADKTALTYRDRIPSGVQVDTFTGVLGDADIYDYGGLYRIRLDLNSNEYVISGADSRANAKIGLQNQLISKYGSNIVGTWNAENLTVSGANQGVACKGTSISFYEYRAMLHSSAQDGAAPYSQTGILSAAVLPSTFFKSISSRTNVWVSGPTRSWSTGSIDDDLFFKVRSQAGHTTTNMGYGSQLYLHFYRDTVLLGHIFLYKIPNGRNSIYYIRDASGSTVYEVTTVNTYGFFGDLQISKTSVTFTNRGGSVYASSNSFATTLFSTANNVTASCLNYSYDSTYPNGYQSYIEVAYLVPVSTNPTTQTIESGAAWGPWNTIATIAEGGADPLLYSVKANPALGDTLVWDGTTWVNQDVLETGVVANTVAALTDTQILSPNTNQVLQWNGNKWINADISAGASAVTELTDVTLTDATNNDILRYNGTKWVNVQFDYNNLINKPNITPGTLDSLSDVEVVTPALNNVLKYDGTRWINDAIPSTSYVRTFSALDLIDGILTVTHNLSSQHNLVVLYDNSNKMVVPDDVTATSISQCTIDLTTYGSITGNWVVKVLK